MFLQISPQNPIKHTPFGTIYQAAVFERSTTRSTTRAGGENIGTKKHYTQLTDGELVSRTLGGETDAFGELVNRHKYKVMSVAQSILRDYHTAEYCAQEVFLDAFVNLRTLLKRESVGAWLYGIARRKALHTYSRTKFFDDLSDYTDSLADNFAAPEHRVLASESRREITEAFARLSEKNRSVATLYFLHGVNTPEIARRLNLPVGTVTYRLHAARQKLKGELRMTENIKNDDFTQSVLDKVKSLRKYYIDGTGTEEGFRNTLAETKKLVVALPESTDKQFALAELYSATSRDTIKDDEAFNAAIDAAEHGKNHDALLTLLVEKWIGMSPRIDIAREFLHNYAVPRMTASGDEFGIGVMKLWYARSVLELGETENALENFREAYRLIRKTKPENVYAAVAAAAISAIELSIEHTDTALSTPGNEAVVLGEQIRLVDGVLRFEGQPGFGGKRSFADRHALDYVTYYASQFAKYGKTMVGGIFYDLSMDDGETRTSDDGSVMTLVSRDEEVRTPAGFFGRCLYIRTQFGHSGSQERIFADAWYAPNIGLVKFHARDDTHDETYELDEYEVKSARGGDDDYFPMAVGNRWNYVKADLPDYIYQRNERKIEWTDGNYATYSVVQIYSLKKDFRSSTEITSELYIEMCKSFCADWKINEAIKMLRCAVRVNTNRTDVDAALRGINYLTMMRDYHEKEYRFCPSHFGASSLMATDGRVTYNESGIYDFGPYRFGTRMEENRIFGVKPLRYLHELMGCIWDDAWVAGYSAEIPHSGGELSITVTDAGAITVPAGTFEGCIKLTFTLEPEHSDPYYYFDQYANMHCGVKEYWFAPGVGIVRHDCKWGDILSASCELVRYSTPAADGEMLPVAIGSTWEYDETNLTAEGYHAKRKMEITGGVLGKFTLCESQEFLYLGTETQYEEFKATLAG